MARRLTRNANDKIIAGVCSGLARYFNIDPVIIRVIWGVSFFRLWDRTSSLPHFLVDSARRISPKLVAKCSCFSF